jgi:osmotically-inducible protein OsmY
VRSSRIRAAIRPDKELPASMLARVRIAARDAKVTLCGTVPTVADKVEVEQRVRQVSGVETVDNQLEPER